MKILLTNPPAYLYDHNRHFLQAGSRWSFSMDAPKGNHAFPHYQPYPFSLAYAASILRQEGHEVDAFDGCALDMDEKEFMERVEKTSPELLVVEIPTVSFPLVMDLLDVVQRVVGCEVVVTGSHITAATQFPPSCLPTLAESFFAVTGDWDIHIGEASDFSLPFEKYPLPDRVDFPHSNYSNFEFFRPSAQMLTSKGCSLACSFCVERHVVYASPAVECRTPRNVVDEMEQLKAEGVRQVHFDDMDITVKRKHIQSICDEILHRKLDLPWTCLADMATAEPMLPFMATAGCIGLAFGLESITPESIQWHKRFVTRERAASFVSKCRDFQVHAHATCMIGLPGETRESILENIRFATGEVDADSVQFSIATPFPGTPFFAECKRNGWLVTEDWTRYDGARYSVTDYPALKHGEIEELFQHAMQQRKEKRLGFRDKVHS